MSVLDTVGERLLWTYGFEREAPRAEFQTALSDPTGKSTDWTPSTIDHPFVVIPNGYDPDDHERFHAAVVDSDSDGELRSRSDGSDDGEAAAEGEADGATSAEAEPLDITERDGSEDDDSTQRVRDSFQTLLSARVLAEAEAGYYSEIVEDIAARSDASVDTVRSVVGGLVWWVDSFVSTHTGARQSDEGAAERLAMDIVRNLSPVRADGGSRTSAPRKSSLKGRKFKPSVRSLFSIVLTVAVAGLIGMDLVGLFSLTEASTDLIILLFGFLTSNLLFAPPSAFRANGARGS